MAVLRHPFSRAARRSHREGLAYQVWIARRELGPTRSRELEQAVAALPETPLLSVLMPVYNVPEDLLREAIESVRSQIYRNWELCIADDCSTEAHVRPLLEEYAALDPRIRLVCLSESGGIACATNSAFEVATGGWVAKLDAFDLLAPQALAEVALEIGRHPQAELIYSDEDRISAKGKRHAPFFKPDFSRELFRSRNYLDHLTVHRAANIRAVGGWRSGFEGSQDYDVNLRVFERIDMANIRHIPRILYHKRAAENSAAVADPARAEAWSAGLRALEEHVARMNLPAVAEKAPGTPFYRLRFQVPEPEPLVSLVIPARDKVELTRACVESIRAKTTYRNYEIIVVDNGSTEQATLAYLAEIAERPNVRVLGYDEPFNYSAINNFAVGHAGGSIIGLINNDIEVISPEWLTEMVSWAVQKDVGCVGAKLLYADGRVQHAGVVLGVGGIASHAHHGRGRHDPGHFGRAMVVNNFSAVTAACLLVRKSIYDEVGGLNETDLEVALSDVDFCLKVRQAGYLNVWTPYAEMYHHESLSRGYEDTPEKKERFRREMVYMRDVWGPILDADPYYSIHLSKTYPDFSVAI